MTVSSLEGSPTKDCKGPPCPEEDSVRDSSRLDTPVGPTGSREGLGDRLCESSVSICPSTILRSRCRPYLTAGERRYGLVDFAIPERDFDGNPT